MDRAGSDYWEFSVWFVHNYGHLMLENYYEQIQIVAYHTWVASRVQVEITKDLCEGRR